MSSGRNITISSTMLYVIPIVVIIVAFLLLGGGSWMNGMMHDGRSIRVNNWNWAQILVSLGIGFVLGIVVARRKW